MKTQISLLELLTDHVGPYVTVTSDIDIDIEQIFANATYDCDLDIDACLARDRMIARYWSTEDVLGVRPDLTEDQAWEVLKRAEIRLACDSAHETFDEIATEMFGVAGRQARRLGQLLEDYAEGDPSANLTELLADARHWCDRHEQPFGKLDAAAHCHYLHELDVRGAEQ